LSPIMSSSSGPTVVHLSDFGAQPLDSSQATEAINAAALNKALGSLRSGDTLLIRGVYHTNGGLVGTNLTDVTIQLDGQLVFSSSTRRWPRYMDDRGKKGGVMECLHLINPVNVTLTSSLGRGADGGVLDGSGAAWWGIPFVGYLIHVEDRPRLLRVSNGTQMMVENWLLLDPPYWAATFDFVAGLEVRYVGIQARRTSNEGHGLTDLSALNTDGFDVSGRDVWIHDCNVWNQDDCIAVKGCPSCGLDDPLRLSENMLFERINATGMGLTIGSIGGNSAVHNITFRDSVIYKTYKGIYMKFRHSNLTSISNILFENVLMVEPEQWPIWIGPAQQADTRNICHANPCSICWPYVPGAECRGQENATYQNVTLRNVTIQRPVRGAGVIMADPHFPMEGVVFDGVRVDPCGSSESNPSVDETFPMLPLRSRRDSYVEGSQLLAFAAILLLGTALIKKIASCASHPRWRTRRTIKVASVAAAASAVVVPLAARTVQLALSMSQPDGYFVCKGVDAGVATGKTWPVPSCFVDRTDPGSAGPDCGVLALKPAVGAWLTSVALLLVAVLAVWVSWNAERCDPMDKYFVELPQMHSEDDGEFVPMNHLKGEERGKLVLVS